MVPKNFNLGYACINTELREQKPAIFTSRTLRLETLKTKGLEYVKQLAIQNVKDLLTILKWNKEHDIYFMRISSEMFPFAAHPEYGYSLDFVDDLLKEIGIYAKENNIRITAHPSHFNILSSPSESVLENSFRDLNHHCDIFDRMGLDHNSVMIIHGGGVYGNKEKALERLETNILRLPENTKSRLVLENCEMAYTVEDLLPISEKLQIPITIDFHHDEINPSTENVSFYFERVFAVWNNRGIKPKVHVSNSVPGITNEDSKTARRKHSDLIYRLHDSLLDITFQLDVMLEAKLKEQAILKLRNL
jgi:UV DNA damage endonuclease